MQNLLKGQKSVLVMTSVITLESNSNMYKFQTIMLLVLKQLHNQNKHIKLNASKIQAENVPTNACY